MIYLGTLLFLRLFIFLPLQFGKIHTQEIPPYVTSPGSTARVDITDDYPKDYECQADGTRPISFTWYKDNTSLGVGEDNKKVFKNGTLYFHKFTKEDDGIYHCTASNTYGTDVSFRFRIVKLYIPHNPYPKEEIQVHVKRGLNVSMPCKVPKMTVGSYMIWSRQQRTESKGFHQLKKSERIGVDSQGNLRFAYVEPGDARKYYCELGNDSEKKTFSRYDLLVQDNPQPGDMVPHPEFVTKNAKAIIGRQFFIECFFSGKPVPNISWKNNFNQDIHVNSSVYKIEDFGRRLKIKKVREQDEGTYKCTAQNTMAESSAEISVNVTSPPLKVSGLSTYTRPAHQGVTLTCEARAAQGERLDPPIWYRNGENLSRRNLPDAERYNFSADFTKLMIRDLVKTKDMACYQCLVNNSEGELYMKGYLRVIDSITISNKPRDTIRISNNRSAIYDLTVYATGDNCCELSFLYKHNNIQLSNKVLHTAPFRSNRSTGVLSFEPGSVSKEVLRHWLGQYVCNISDQYQYKLVHFSIEETVSASTGLWWIAILFGILAIIIIALVVFVVYRRKNPGNVYLVERKELANNLNPVQELKDCAFKEI